MNADSGSEMSKSEDNSKSQLQPNKQNSKDYENESIPNPINQENCEICCDDQNISEQSKSMPEKSMQVKTPERIFKMKSQGKINCVKTTESSKTVEYGTIMAMLKEQQQNELEMEEVQDAPEEGAEFWLLFTLLTINKFIDCFHNWLFFEII